MALPELYAESAIRDPQPSTWERGCNRKGKGKHAP